MRVWLVAVLAGLIGFGLARWMGEVRTDSPADPEVASVGAEGAGTDPDAAPLAPAAASKSEATRDVTFRRRQHEISKVDRTVFSDVGVASENGK